MLLREGKNQANETVIPPEVIRKAATGVTVYIPVACVEFLREKWPSSCIILQSLP